MKSPMLVLSLGAVLCVSNAVAADDPPVPATRETFLERVDVALASREAARVAALVDTNAWREAGYPDLGDLKMALPQGPLVRDRDLSQTSVAYKNPTGRSWRLTLRHDAASDTWLAVARTNLCPRGGIRASRRMGHETPKPAVENWTILECWPLPM